MADNNEGSGGDGSNGSNSSTFSLYNPESGKTERYSKNQSYGTRIYENATVSDKTAKMLHAYRSRNGYQTKDPADTGS